jgi:hypothetical protein
LGIPIGVEKNIRERCLLTGAQIKVSKMSAEDVCWEALKLKFQKCQPRMSARRRSN